MKKVFAFVLAFLLAAPAVWGEDTLPAPEKTGGMSLLQALSERRSTREFADTDLTPQQLSNLLWAAAGVNRPDEKRVYPTALGIQDTLVYVLNREGIYKYNPVANTLTMVEKGDHRMDTTQGQGFAARAAVNLVYVHDASVWDSLRNMKGWTTPQELVIRWGYAHTGAIVQNAYLYAASQGWNSVVRGSFDQAKLSKLLKLSEGQAVTLVQSIGPRP
ncbi:MAG: nitroreductase family protein [Fretibacterium sp.]|nr:nitroreductase family protein [Fretibacterium sp.]